MDPVALYIAVQLCIPHLHHRWFTNKRYFDEGFEQCELIRQESWSFARRNANITFINTLAAEIEEKRKSAGK